MAMLPGDYKRRTNSTQRNSATTAWICKRPSPCTTGSANFQVCPATSIVNNISINATSTGTNVFFKDSAGTIQMIGAGLTTARDYKMCGYCPWPLYISTDADITVTVSPPSKGNTTD